MEANRRLEESGEACVIDATGIHYRELNRLVRIRAREGYRQIVLDGVNGQRYIGDGMTEDVQIVINGVPGNDLGAFMDGPTVVVNDNVQDGVGNTMNKGKIIIKGHAGDVLGYGMRGGRVLVSRDVGYRVGIHMKSYLGQVPAIVVGGCAGDFFGEYMAGGILVLIGMGREGEPPVGNYVGTGMHGGTIYIRGSITDRQLGREVRIYPLNEEDLQILGELLDDFKSSMGIDVMGLEAGDFIKLRPFSHRPYGGKYVY